MGWRPGVKESKSRGRGRVRCPSQGLVAKSKSKYILVRMKSAAETGYCFNEKKKELGEELLFFSFSPIAKQRVLFTEKRKIRSI
nr:39S ribosomal protein L33, mitochondrial [Columba livia]